MRKRTVNSGSSNRMPKNECIMIHERTKNISAVSTKKKEYN